MNNCTLDKMLSMTAQMSASNIGYNVISNVEIFSYYHALSVMLTKTKQFLRFSMFRWNIKGF